MQVVPCPALRPGGKGDHEVGPHPTRWTLDATHATHDMRPVTPKLHTLEPGNLRGCGVRAGDESRTHKSFEARVAPHAVRVNREQR